MTGVVSLEVRYVMLLCSKAEKSKRREAVAGEAYAEQIRFIPFKCWYCVSEGRLKQMGDG